MMIVNRQRSRDLIRSTSQGQQQYSFVQDFPELLQANCEVTASAVDGDPFSHLTTVHRPSCIIQKLPIFIYDVPKMDA
jgi:hypothetical protein